MSDSGDQMSPLPRWVRDVGIASGFSETSTASCPHPLLVYLRARHTEIIYNSLDTLGLLLPLSFHHLCSHSL